MELFLQHWVGQTGPGCIYMRMVEVTVIQSVEESDKIPSDARIVLDIAQ